MKIVLFIHSLSVGGAERVLTTLANHWSAQGRDIVVATLAEASDQEYVLEPTVRRISFNLASSSSNILVGLWQNARRILALRQLLRKEKPAVAVAMMSSASVLLAIAALGLNIKTIGSERTFPARQNLTSSWAQLRAFTYGWLDCVVVQTQKGATWLQANTRVRKVAVIPNPSQFPLAAGEPRILPADIIPAGQRILLCVGRMIAAKRFDRAIRSFASICEGFPDWSLAIVGDGELREQLVEQALQSGADRRIYFPGAVGNPGDWYAQSDAYMLTSEYEGFPNTLLEAMAHGLPAIATDCDTGPSDIIQDNINGILVPNGDEQALCASLQHLLSSRELRQSLGIAALRVRQDFELQTIANLWADEFRRSPRI